MAENSESTDTSEVPHFSEKEILEEEKRLQEERRSAMAIALEMFSRNAINIETPSEDHAREQGKLLGCSVVDAIGSTFFIADFASAWGADDGEEHSELREKMKKDVIAFTEGTVAFLRGILGEIEKEMPVLLEEIDGKDEEEDNHNEEEEEEVEK